jgi:hypothetical protein
VVERKGLSRPLKNWGKRGCGLVFFGITLCCMYIEASVCLTFLGRHSLPDVHGIRCWCQDMHVMKCFDSG